MFLEAKKGLEPTLRVLGSAFGDFCVSTFHNGHTTRVTRNSLPLRHFCTAFDIFILPIFRISRLMIYSSFAPVALFFFFGESTDHIVWFFPGDLALIEWNRINYVSQLVFSLFLLSECRVGQVDWLFHRRHSMSQGAEKRRDKSSFSIVGTSECYVVYIHAKEKNELLQWSRESSQRAISTMPNFIQSIQQLLSWL